MALTVKQQIEHQIKGCHSAIIVIPELPSADAITSALALQHIIQKYSKDVSIVSWAFDIPEKLSFLPEINSIKPDISLLPKSIIQVETDLFPVSDISYHVKENKLQILVSPKTKEIPSDAFKISKAPHAHDLIITINTSELPALGNFYTKYKNFFDQTKIINIDHRPDNEHYGQINWVDINYSSTSEMLYNFIYNPTIPPADIATTLLAGIMEETHSFRTHQVKPQTLQIVSKLLEAGADHEAIVNNIYRTKTVGLLKLWGHVLDNLQADRELSLAWSVIPESIFSTTGTGNQQLQDLMNEILSHSSEARTVVLFIEHKTKEPSVEVQIQTTPPLHAKDLLKNWQPFGSERNAKAIVKGVNLHETERDIIKVVKNRLSSIMGK